LQLTFAQRDRHLCVTSSPSRANKPRDRFASRVEVRANSTSANLADCRDTFIAEQPKWPLARCFLVGREISFDIVPQRAVVTSITLSISSRNQHCPRRSYVTYGVRSEGGN
jgi:hypothetical protein